MWWSDFLKYFWEEEKTLKGEYLENISIILAIIEFLKVKADVKVIQTHYIWSVKKKYNTPGQSYANGLGAFLPRHSSRGKKWR